MSNPKYWLYRPFNKIIHKFNFHHTRFNPGLAERSGLPRDTTWFVPEICDWCGLRGKKMATSEQFRKIQEKHW